MNVGMLIDKYMVFGSDVGYLFQWGYDLQIKQKYIV